MGGLPNTSRIGPPGQNYWLGRERGRRPGMPTTWQLDWSGTYLFAYFFKNGKQAWTLVKP